MYLLDENITIEEHYTGTTVAGTARLCNASGKPIARIVIDEVTVSYTNR